MKNKRSFKTKSLSVLSTAALLGSMISNVSASSALTDIPNNYAKEAILELVSKGIMNGTGNGKFSPAGSITRQDFAIVLANALELNVTAAPATATFNDVPSTHYAFPAVEAAVQAGIINGIGGGLLGATQNITREQMAVMFVKALKLNPADVAVQTNTLTFSDASQISSWAKGSVAAAVELGLLAGKPDGSFDPLHNASRQEVAWVASKFLAEKNKRDEQTDRPAQSQQPVESGIPSALPAPTLAPSSSTGIVVEPGTPATPAPTPEPQPTPTPTPSQEPTPTPSQEPTPVPNYAPEAESVKIEGEKLEAGETLTGVYTYFDRDGDAEGSTLFKWYRVDNDGVSNKIEIQGAASKVYALTAEDSGHKVIFEVTPVDGNGISGLPVSAITDADIEDPAPAVIPKAGTTPAEQLYSNTPLAPASVDKDIESAELWRTNAQGLDYQSQVYEEQVTDYQWGDTVSADGNYKLAVKDKGGNVTTVYFTIDQLTPSIAHVEQQQDDGINPDVYDSNDVITIQFSDYIKKFDFYDELSANGNAGDDSGLTMALLEEAAQKSGYSFGEGARLSAASYIPVNPLYGNDFEITLGDNANLPIDGAELKLDAADIFTPSQTKAAGETVSIFIPALEPSNHAPVLNEEWTAPDYTVGETASLDLTGLFTDQDQEDILTYSAESLNPAIATVEEDQGNSFTVSPLAAGTAQIKVTVSDGKTSKETIVELTVQDAPQLLTPFISEMVWGSGDGEIAVEFFNPTDQDITSLKVKIGDAVIEITEEFKIPANGVLVISDWNLLFDIPVSMNYSIPLNINTDTNQPIDVLLYINGDEENPVDVSKLYPLETMRRNSGVTRGSDSYKSSEWKVFATDSFENIGSYE